MPIEFVYTWDEISQHNTKQSLWIVIDQHVFDVTTFTDHPGGIDILLQHGGKDATEDFNSINHVDGLNLMHKFCIGQVSN